MKSCEIRGKELLDANILTAADLYEWLRGKNINEAAIVGVGLPCYSLLQTLLFSIKANSSGVLLLDDFEITYLNRPKDKLLDWFFNPVMVLKEQIRVIKLVEGEVRYLEKVVLFGSNKQRLEACDNGSLVITDALRAAQIEGISRRYVTYILQQQQSNYFLLSEVGYMDQSMPPTETKMFSNFTISISYVCDFCFSLLLSK